MSKPFIPPRKAVAVRPSKIRREPVRLTSDRRDERLERKAAAQSLEREMWGGVAGVILMAVALSVLIVGISFATLFHADSGPQAPRFGQCYNGGPDCVVDGDTIYVDAAKVRIAGIEAPSIQGAKCEAERTRGITAAVWLAEMLSAGEVKLGKSVRGPDGQVGRTVLVNGDDVGKAMLAEDLAVEPGSEPHDWC